MAPKRAKNIVVKSTRKVVVQESTVQVSALKRSRRSSKDIESEEEANNLTADNVRTIPVQEATTPQQKTEQEKPMKEGTIEQEKPMKEGTTEQEKPMKEGTTEQEKPMKEGTTEQEKPMKEGTTEQEKPMKEGTTEQEKPMKEGTKGRKRKRKKVGEGGEGYRRYVYKVLKQVHPEMGISFQAMTILNNLMTDMFERLADEATRLKTYTGHATLSSREIQGAVKLLLPGELGKHAIAEGAKAVSNYMSHE
ncbi:hypothetical protein QN277_008202 [Acacia crassicarpa]|uniref:Core Histone H2A/H2B/H3 domain-containing protein n=1 Tax=Acacia crassicarpa TaxID=499986 RepID=A0AAE1M6F7_9FABA|nr:hypothetical protein QN277_008202 [Acacia crassicarpa]